MLGRSHDRIAQVHWDFDLVHVPDEVPNCDKVVGPCCHYRKRVKLKTDYVRENFPAQLPFPILATLSTFVVPSQNAIDCHHQESTGTTGRV